MADATPRATTREEQAAAKVENEDTLKNRLYSVANRKLRDAHKPEFQALLEAEYKANGLEYKRRLTAEEKAAADLERIFTEFPHLRPQGEGEAQPGA